MLYDPLIKVRKPMMGVHRVKSLGARVIRCAGETILGNKSRSILRKMKDIQCYKRGKKNGHIKQECPEWKKGNTENKDGSLKSDNVVEDGDLESDDGDMLSISSSRDHLTDYWIMDSPCSYHMTPTKDRLVNYGFVLIGNDASCRVVGMGKIRVKMFDGVIITLCNVRHVQDLRKNLIS